jgi:hypothetical protein
MELRQLAISRQLVEFKKTSSNLGISGRKQLRLKKASSKSYYLSWGRFIFWETLEASGLFYFSQNDKRLVYKWTNANLIG